MRTTVNPDWKGIEAAYHKGMTLADISGKFEVSLHHLRQRIDVLGWPVRGETIGDTRLRKRKLHMVLRAWNILSEKMRGLEDRALESEASTLNDARDTNTLRTLMVLFEKLTILEKEIREEETQNTGARNDTAERLRSSLARRLTGLDTDPD